MKVEVNGENYQKQRAITDVINKLLFQIEEDTGGSSVHRDKLKHESFLELVEMGDKIVNYIFYLMTEYGGSWIYFLLLQKIVKNPPKLPNEVAGKFIHQTIHWMQWYVESDYYKNNDTYFNLVNGD